MSVSYVAVFVVCFLASLLGPLCGIGGGVIIKPVVDAMGVMPVAAVSFLSSVSVLTMSLATLIQNAMGRTSTVRMRPLLPLAWGSALGGVCGKLLFDAMSDAAPDPEAIGSVQAAVLFALTLLVLVYTRNRSRVSSLRLVTGASKASVGFAAGACWSFLGIGGGPFNLALLTFLFGMEAKSAAQASLFIIAFSQTAGLAYSFVSGSLPVVSPLLLAGMCAMAVMGSIVGRRLVARMDSAAVERLYLLALLLIAGICAYNIARFGGVWG